VKKTLKGVPIGEKGRHLGKEAQSAAARLSPTAEPWRVKVCGDCDEMGLGDQVCPDLQPIVCSTASVSGAVKCSTADAAPALRVPMKAVTLVEPRRVDMAKLALHLPPRKVTGATGLTISERHPLVVRSRSVGEEPRLGPGPKPVPCPLPPPPSPGGSLGPSPSPTPPVPPVGDLTPVFPGPPLVQRPQPVATYRQLLLVCLLYAWLWVVRRFWDPPSHNNDDIPCGSPGTNVPNTGPGVLRGRILSGAEVCEFARGLGVVAVRQMRNVLPYVGERRLVAHRNVVETKQGVEMCYITLRNNRLWRLLRLAWYFVQYLFYVVVRVSVAAFPALAIRGLLPLTSGWWQWLVVKFLLGSDLHYTIGVIIARILLPRWPGFPAKVVYCPHLVSSIITEYTRGTNSLVARSTVRQKILRLASLPLPDFEVSQVYDGSEAVALFCIDHSDFASRPLSMELLAPMVEVS